MSLPAVSVIFLAYKQEAYVVQALRSVLDQDLPDYEVIIGDDASPDRTRELIETEVAAYRGPARIVLLPPQPRLGLIGNITRCVAAATGDILVAAAGDDRSHPTRLRRAAEFFRDNHRCQAYFSNARIIDANGNVVRSRWYRHRGVRYRQFDPRCRHLHQGVPFCGAVGSYRGEVFRQFPAILAGAVGEDGPATLRALLLGAVAVDEEVQVDWRWHGANMSHGSKPTLADWRTKLRRASAWSMMQKSYRRGYLADLAHAGQAGLAAPETISRLRQLVEVRHAQVTVKIHCTHPSSRWSSVGESVRRYWALCPANPLSKGLFLAKALAKKLLPGPVRAFVFFKFSKF